MPKIDQGSQPRTGGTAYAETPAQVAAWKQLRSYMREQGISAGDTFTVPGTIAKIVLDGTTEHPRVFTKPVKDNQGNDKDWPFVKVYAAITDPRFGKPGTLDFPAKNVGASFFDGVTKQGRSPNRGGMYNLHVAVTGQEPSQALKDGKGDWDTEDYENKPILLRLEYQGKEDPDSQYADRRLGMKIFIAGFEKDRSVHRSTDLDDEDDDAPFSTSPPSSLVAAAAREAADLSDQPATERQVKFIYAIGREAGMDDGQVNDWSVELFERDIDHLTRRDASALIDALQRKRNEEASDITTVRKDGEDEDRVVSVGVSTKKPAPPEDDEDLNF